MKKNKKLLLLGIAAVAAYFIFFRKPSGDASGKTQLVALIDSLDETADYKTYFKSRVAEMTSAEVSELTEFLQAGRDPGLMSPAVVSIYQKYSLGS